MTRGDSSPGVSGLQLRPQIPRQFHIRRPRPLGDSAEDLAQEIPGFGRVPVAAPEAGAGGGGAAPQAGAGWVAGRSSSQRLPEVGASATAARKLASASAKGSAVALSAASASRR